MIGLLFCAEPVLTELELNMYCDGKSDYSYYLVLNKTDSLTVLFYDLLYPLPIDPVSASLKVSV